MADTGGPAHESGLDARVGRLESDVSEIRSILNRLAPRIDEMYGFLIARLPELANEAELTGLRAETKAEFADVRREIVELRLEIVQRPTRRANRSSIFLRLSG